MKYETFREAVWNRCNMKFAEGGLEHACVEKW